MDDLTSRLKKLLIAVVEHHISTGRPAGSKYLCQAGDFGVSPSTVRGELSRLEEMGYLDHPYTSAGRVPTDRGYRFYVDCLFQEGWRPGPARAVAPGEPGAQVEDALRQSASLLAESTGLLALVSAPARNSGAIKHVEVLRLHPDLIMVVIITTSGGVAKRLFMFDKSVDPGLVDWASGFLNEAVCDIDLGSLRLKLRLKADVSATENEFLTAISPAFIDLPDGAGSLYLDGVSAFFARLERDGSARLGRLMRLLDRQEEILKLLRSALVKRKVYLLIGSEMPAAAMRNLSLVAANYGLGHRNLGTVGVLGPTRMDYEKAIVNVECAARSLSHYVEEIYN